MLSEEEEEEYEGEAVEEGTKEEVRGGGIVGSLLLLGGMIGLGGNDVRQDGRHEAMSTDSEEGKSGKSFDSRWSTGM